MRSERRRYRREQAVAVDGESLFVARPQDKLDAASIQAAMAALPGEQREVIVLRLWSGLTLAEIADVMNVGVSTVHARYSAAVESLRRILEEP